MLSSALWCLLALVTSLQQGDTKRVQFYELHLTQTPTERKRPWLLFGFYRIVLQFWSIHAVEALERLGVEALYLSRFFFAFVILCNKEARTEAAHILELAYRFSLHWYSRALSPANEPNGRILRHIPKSIEYVDLNWHIPWHRIHHFSSLYFLTMQF